MSKSSKREKLTGKILKPFRSVKLMIILLILLTIASLIGTLVPQGRSPAEYSARYGRLAGVVTGLQLSHLYSSFWYIALLLLIALNISVCTLTRLGPRLRRVFNPRPETDPADIEAMKSRDAFRKEKSLEFCRVEFRRLLRARHYRLKEESDADRVLLLARKRTLGWLGADIVHVGLLVILTGGIVSGLLSFRTCLTLNEGDVLSVPRAFFRVRLDQFATEYYPDGNVKDWKSTLSLLRDGKPVVNRTIEVNHPLHYQGYRFYQSGYGWNWDNPLVEIQVGKKDDPAFVKTAKLKIGETFPLDDPGRTRIQVSRFLPDFVLDDANRPQSRSLELRNPAALIEGWRAGERVFSGWIFARFPGYAQIHSGQETDWSFELKSFDAAQYSVVEVAKDPASNIIWAGCLLVMAGLFLAFYWPAREIRILLEDRQGKTGVVAGGVSPKSREVFEKEFGDIMAAMRRIR